MQKTNYLLHLADTNLILSQRNSEWCGHGPILEQDIAITNISLDLLGQARNFYQYAASLINLETPGNGSMLHPGIPASEDSLANLRSEREFNNLLLVEQENGDWGHTLLRQFLYSQFQFLLYEKLGQSLDRQIAAIATKSLKETTYHLKWSREWVIRLGDGTTESHQRMLHAMNELWPYTGEMFIPASYEVDAETDPGSLKDEWSQKVNIVLEEAKLPIPEKIFMQTGGKEGRHTEYLGHLLSELQYMQRAWPGCEW